jgi:hypothetical protein
VTQLKSVDFEAYIHCFKEGDTAEQVDMTWELFSERSVAKTGSGIREATRA